MRLNSLPNPSSLTSRPRSNQRMLNLDPYSPVSDSNTEEVEELLRNRRLEGTQPGGQRLTFSVDPTSDDLLKSLGYKMFYGFGSVHVRQRSRHSAEVNDTTCVCSRDRSDCPNAGRQPGVAQLL
ncbi:hypothetical protein ACLKA7_007888 [Drosophila subpalustris]